MALLFYNKFPSIKKVIRSVEMVASVWSNRFVTPDSPRFPEGTEVDQ